MQQTNLENTNNNLNLALVERGKAYFEEIKKIAIEELDKVIDNYDYKLNMINYVKEYTFESDGDEIDSMYSFIRLCRCNEQLGEKRAFFCEFVSYFLKEMREIILNSFEFLEKSLNIYESMNDLTFSNEYVIEFLSIVRAYVFNSKTN